MEDSWEFVSVPAEIKHSTVGKAMSAESSEMGNEKVEENDMKVRINQSKEMHNMNSDTTANKYYGTFTQINMSGLLPFVVLLVGKEISFLYDVV